MKKLVIKLEKGYDDDKDGRVLKICSNEQFETLFLLMFSYKIRVYLLEKDGNCKYD